MTAKLTAARRVGYIAAVLAAAAGLAEIAAGATSWTGDKSQPTTLGIVTLALAAIVAVAAWATPHVTNTRGGLAVAIAMAAPAVIILTTAGLAAVPAAIAGIAAAAIAVADAHDRGRILAVIAADWPVVLLAVLALIYLAFGLVAGAPGLLGVAGAASVVVALTVRRRSPRLAAVILAAGALPFAIVAWWSVVIPFTAALLLAIGIPHLLTRRPLAATEQTPVQP